MPPPARVCKACKASKVRCIEFEPGVTCARCTRLGLLCEPAPQRPKSETMPLAVQFMAPSESSETLPPVHVLAQAQPSADFSLVAPDISTDVIVPRANETHNVIWRAVRDATSPQVAAFTLRHMAMIAKRRNAYGLLEDVVRACKEKSIDLAAVLDPAGDDADDAGASTHPFEILRVVSDARGYCLARSIAQNGHNSFYNNAAFEHDVLSVEACNRIYERNERSVVEAFVHQDDMAAVNGVMAELFRAAASNSGQLTLSNGLERVCVFHLRLQTYVACSMRMWMLIRCDQGTVSSALEMTMLDEDGVGCANAAIEEMTPSEDGNGGLFDDLSDAAFDELFGRSFPNNGAHEDTARAASAWHRVGMG